MLTEEVATFGVGVVKENWERLGSAAPSFYIYQNSMTATFLPWSAVLLFSSVGSKSLSSWHGPAHRPVWNTELVWISRLCVYWQVVQPHRNGSVGPNSWCWGPDRHIIRVWRGVLFRTSCKLWFRCCLGVYLPFTFIRKTPILYTLRLLYNVNHSTVNGADLKEKYRLTVNKPLMQMQPLSVQTASCSPTPHGDKGWGSLRQGMTDVVESIRHTQL